MSLYQWEHLKSYTQTATQTHAHKDKSRIKTVAEVYTASQPVCSPSLKSIALSIPIARDTELNTDGPEFLVLPPPPVNRCHLIAGVTEWHSIWRNKGPNEWHERGPLSRSKGATGSESLECVCRRPLRVAARAVMRQEAISLHASWYVLPALSCLKMIRAKRERAFS